MTIVTQTTYDMNSMHEFSLVHALTRATENVLARGVLRPISTGITYVEEVGVERAWTDFGT